MSVFLPEQLRRECVEAAVQAPSIHNTQPWRFVAHPDAFEVHVDLARRLDVIDPTARALYISCGAAASNIRVVLAARGYHSRVEITVDAASATYIATVIVRGTRHVSDEDRARHRAIRSRHTSREPFENRLVSESVLGALVASAAAEEAQLRFLDEDERDAFLAVVRTAEIRERTDPRYRRELRDWTSGPGAMRDDGVPAEAFGAWSAMEAVPIRDFALEQKVPRMAKRFELEPTVGMLSTRWDGRADWLRAGMALQRVWLDATSARLALCPMTQPLELPELRRLLAARTPLAVPQVLFRVGHGRPGRASPRRPVSEVIVGGTYA